MKSIGNAFYLAAIGVPLGMLTSLTIAMRLNTNVRGRQLHRTAFYIPSIVPVVATTVLIHAVADALQDVSGLLADPELAWMFTNCFPSTLGTTVQPGEEAEGRPDTFVITGDIGTMWLRAARPLCRCL